MIGRYLENIDALFNYVKDVNCEKILFVCGSSFKNQDLFFNIKDKLEEMECRISIFSGYSANPKYEEVCAGIKVFNDNQCGIIIAVGGGSAIDVAKCIKAFANHPCGAGFASIQIESDVPLIAIPTTAGSGSEETRFAVLYYDGEKRSVESNCLLPDRVLFLPELLDSLPIYQRKATALDAYCHAIESYWSVGASEESKEYSKRVFKLIRQYWKQYLDNHPEGNEKMLLAANYAGKAINITKTTAGHAMCYKLTSLYGIAHGHAAALCVSKLWHYLINYAGRCTDYDRIQYKHGIDDLKKNVEELKETMTYFQFILAEMNLENPRADEVDYLILEASVNIERLKNFPIKLDALEINNLYHEILE